MKPLTLLLAASLVANAAWITTHALRPDPTASAASHASNATARATATASSTPAPADRASFIATLKSDNPEALRDLLREGGLPDETVRMLVSASIWKRYSDRMKALQPKPDEKSAWWKNENDWYGSKMTREQRAEMRRLQREAQDESVRILGPSPDNQGWGGWQDTRLSFLPESKRKTFHEIDQDYQELIQEAQQEMQGFTLPSDAEKIRFLQEEKKRDLAAILTPQELADYELRMSPTAQQLRWKMTRFDGTEEEYRKIFAVQQAHDATRQLDAWGNPMNPGATDWKQRQEEEKQVNARIKEALGADRYADYIRSQNHEYQQLAAATKRLSLPPETTNEVFNLRTTVSTESQRIADNPNLTYDQKKQELAALAQKTREQVRTRLGDEASQVYLKNGMNWLNQVEQGNVITFSENGQQTNARSLPKADIKPATAK